MLRRQKDLTLERQWRARIAQCQSSGLSIREFCDRQGLAEPTFYSWKRALRLRDEASSKTPCVPPTFIPVTLLPEATVSVEVRCPSGHVVSLAACEVSALAPLFAALKASASEEPSC